MVCFRHLCRSVIILITSFLDIRNDCHQHHVETLDAVRGMANEQVPYNVQRVSTVFC